MVKFELIHPKNFKLLNLEIRKSWMGEGKFYRKQKNRDQDEKLESACYKLLSFTFLGTG